MSQTGEGFKLLATAPPSTDGRVPLRCAKHRAVATPMPSALFLTSASGLSEGSLGCSLCWKRILVVVYTEKVCHMDATRYNI
jgi:hypothetical protein